MYEIQKKAEELLRLIDKEKNKISPKNRIEVDALKNAAENFTGYKVNGFGTLVPKKK